jgi:hypothetical protein
MAGPAVELTQQALLEAGHPILSQTYFDTSIRPPKRLPRLQAAPGPHKTGDDPHIAGRALDIILFSNVDMERAIANDLVGIFLDLRADMRWIAVIYNGNEWNSQGIRFDRTRVANGIHDPVFEHRTHIHIEWGLSSINTKGFSDALDERLAQAFDSDDLGRPTY